MTLVNIRGTSGSGKSTLVRNVLACYGAKQAYKEEGRKQPIGYSYTHPLQGGRVLGVVGHYETACGGCDTISGYEKIFRLVRETHDAGMDVLFEGLLISGDVKWTKTLLDLPLRILALTTPIDVCVASINERRRAKRGEDAPEVNPTNTIAKAKTLASCMTKLRAEGADCHEASREDALGLVKTWLGLP
jgi:hypothetical protein